MAIFIVSRVQKYVLKGKWATLKSNVVDMGKRWMRTTLVPKLGLYGDCITTDARLQQSITPCSVLRTVRTISASSITLTEKVMCNSRDTKPTRTSLKCEVQYNSNAVHLLHRNKTWGSIVHIECRRTKPSGAPP